MNIPTRMLIVSLAMFHASIAMAQNVGIGLDNPQFPLHVNGVAWATTHWGNYGRFNNYVRIGASYDNAFKLHVDNGDTKLDGKLEVTGTSKISGNVGIGADALDNRKLFVSGSIEASGYVFSSFLGVTSAANIGTNLIVGGNTTVGANLNVTNDGIIDGNFRINGPIGIGGATQSEYKLIVNNGNSYFQGNINSSGNATILGTVNAAGDLKVKGNGHVRSNGPSNLRIGFDQRSFNNTIGAGAVVDFTASITDFDNGNGDVRVYICQYDPDPDPAYSTWWPYFSMKVYDVDPVANTCRIRVWNQAAATHTLKGTVYLATIAKD